MAMMYESHTHLSYIGMRSNNKLSGRGKAPPSGDTQDLPGLFNDDNDNDGNL